MTIIVVLFVLLVLFLFFVMSYLYNHNLKNRLLAESKRRYENLDTTEQRALVLQNTAENFGLQLDAAVSELSEQFVENNNNLVSEKNILERKLVKAQEEYKKIELQLNGTAQEAEGYIVALEHMKEDDMIIKSFLVNGKELIVNIKDLAFYLGTTVFDESSRQPIVRYAAAFQTTVNQILQQNPLLAKYLPSWVLTDVLRVMTVEHAKESFVLIDQDGSVLPMAEADVVLDVVFTVAIPVELLPLRGFLESFMTSARCTQKAYELFTELLFRNPRFAALMLDNRCVLFLSRDFFSEVEDRYQSCFSRYFDLSACAKGLDGNDKSLSFWTLLVGVFGMCDDITLANQERKKNIEDFLSFYVGLLSVDGAVLIEGEEVPLRFLPLVDDLVLNTAEQCLETLDKRFDTQTNIPTIQLPDNVRLFANSKQNSIGSDDPTRKVAMPPELDRSLAKKV